MSGFVAKFGIDTSDFSRGLDKLVPRAKQASAKLEAVFENGQERRKRAIRKTTRFVKERAGSLNKAWLAATAAFTVGVGLMSRALERASEQNDRVRFAIQGVRSDWQDMWTNIGTESSLLLNQQLSWGKAWEWTRKAAVDYYAVLFSGSLKHVRNINNILKLEKDLTRQRKSQRALYLENLQLDARGGDQDATDRLELIQYTTRLNEQLTQKLITNTEMNGLLDRFKELQRQERLTNQGDAASFLDRTNALDLSVLSARAKTPAQQAALLKRQAREEERLAIRDIRKDTKLSEEEQRQLIEQTTWAIKERTRARIEEIQEQQRQAKKQAQQQAQDQLKTNAIEKLRLSNKEKLADAKQVELELEQRIRDINGQDIDAATKERLIESEKELARLKLQGLTREAEAGGALAAGSFASGTSRQQVLGVPRDGGSSQGNLQTTVQGILAKVEQMVEEIRESNQQGSAPVIL